jgi:undecaprenyl-diphosphatase
MPRRMTNPHRSESRDAGRRAAVLAGVAVAATAGFAAIAAAVATRETAHADEKARRRTSARRKKTRKAADAIGPLGKWWTYIPAGVAASAYVLRADGADEAAPSRRAGAGAITLSAVVATALNHAFDRWLPQPPPPPGRKQRNKPVFPSGHAFGPTAVGLATAYVLAREELASPAAAVPIALAVPAVTAGGRLVTEKHWMSDVLGGFVGGIALAAGCAAAYEAARALRDGDGDDQGS